jgi:hypothetical protein
MVTLKTTAALLVLVLATSAAGSEVEAKQRGTMINVNYSIAAPIHETRSFTADGSFQGLGMEVRLHGKRFIGGLGISWQIFRDEIQAPGTASGAQFEARTASLIPILASGYVVFQHGAARTFIGAGVGGIMAHHLVKAQAEEISDTAWYTAASGFAGALLELAPGFGLETQLRYVGGFKNGSKAIGMVQLTMGITFIY